EWTEPSLGYSFSGHRYVLGWTERRFAIWDRGRIAQPAISFPRTPGGWEMAWNRFIGMEPGAVAVGGRASIPELGSRPYWVSTRVPAVAVVTIAGAALLVLAWAVVEAVAALTSAPTLLGWASAID